MIIGGVHWLLATAIAVAIHLAGIAWLSLAEPVRQIEPEGASEGIVVTLGQQAGNAGESAESVAAEQGEVVANTAEVTEAQETDEAEAAPDPSSPEREPAPEEAAPEPADVQRTPEAVAAAESVAADAAGETMLSEFPSVEPEPAAEREAEAADAPAPNDASAEQAAEAVSPEPEAVSARSASEASVAVPQSVEARDAASVEPVPTRDAPVAGGVDTRERAGDSVPVEFADAASIPETPDTEAKAPEAEALWSGGSPESPEADTPSGVPAATADTPAATVARSTPPETSVDATMELEAVEAGSVAAARQPAPEVEQPSVPETSETAVPETVRLEDLQEREPGGTGVVARYAGVIKGWLQKNMHYPRAARLAGQEGDVVVRFIIDRDGNVQTIELEAGSGYPLLDREAREMIERGDPFPAMPLEMPGQRLEVRVPVSFHVRDETRQKEIPPIYLD